MRNTIINKSWRKFINEKYGKTTTEVEYIKTKQREKIFMM